MIDQVSKLKDRQISIDALRGLAMFLILQAESSRPLGAKKPRGFDFVEPSGVHAHLLISK